jgi:hypothetical protein
VNTKRTLIAVTAAALLAATATGAAAPHKIMAKAQARACTPVWKLVRTPPLPDVFGRPALGPPALVSRSDIWFPSTGVLSGPEPDAHPGMLRWNGKSVVAAPEPVTMSLLLKSVEQASFDSGTDGWALGRINAANAVSQPPQPYAAHWNGRRWKIIPFVGPQDRAAVSNFSSALDGIAAVSPTSAWAVGALDDPAGNTHGAIIEHWNGSRWSLVANPASTPSSAGGLFALKVISPTNVWSAGRQRNASGTVVPLVEHWNGKAWSIVPVPTGTSPSALDVISAPGPKDIWVADDQLRPGTPLVEHWNGKTWKVLSLPDLGANGAKATGIYAASSSDVWVTILVPAVPGNVGVLLHWNGAKWTKVPPPGPHELGVTAQFNGIAGTGPANIWAAGFTTSLGGEEPLLAHLACS